MITACTGLLNYGERPHHVVVFMGENMTMDHVCPKPVELGSDPDIAPWYGGRWITGCIHGSGRNHDDILEPPLIVGDGVAHVECSRVACQGVAVGIGIRIERPVGGERSGARVCRYISGDGSFLDHLEADQMEVHRVHVHGAVDDDPVFDAVKPGRLGNGIAKEGAVYEQQMTEEHRPFSGGVKIQPVVIGQLLEVENPGVNRCRKVDDRPGGRGGARIRSCQWFRHRKLHDLAGGLRIDVITARERAVGVVAHGDLGADGGTGEVDYYVGPFGKGEEQTVGRGVGDRYRGRQQPAVIADLGYGVGRQGYAAGKFQPDVVEPRVGGVEESETVFSRFNFQFRPDLAVDYDGVAEELGAGGEDLVAVLVEHRQMRARIQERVRRIIERAVIAEPLVLYYKGNLICPFGKVLGVLEIVTQQVEGRQTGIDVEAGQAHGMVMEPEGCGQLVGVVGIGDAVAGGAADTVGRSVRIIAEPEIGIAVEFRRHVPAMEMGDHADLRFSFVLSVEGRVNIEEMFGEQLAGFVAQVVDILNDHLL